MPAENRRVLASPEFSGFFLLICRRCKLDCVLRSPLIMGCLRAVQPFFDLTALWPVGNAETEKLPR